MVFSLSSVSEVLVVKIYLNLPVQIQWTSTKKIDYLYNAAGQKVKKTVRDGSTIKIVDYLDGFQYAGGILQFFPHGEGYVKATQINESPTNPDFAFNYVFNYTDHLGNIRLSFSKDPLTNELKIMEENHYYPFGLKHMVFGPTGVKDFKEDPTGPGTTILTNVTKTEYMYKYNGKELQDELGLGWYDYHARNYDPALGRWNVIDPMAPKYFSHSPYSYTLNNPVYFIDPDGMQVTKGDPDDDVIYNEDDPVVLNTANMGSKKSSSSSWAYIPPAFRNFDIGRNVLGYNYEKHAQLYKDPNWLAGYTKMNEAKREGEWFAVGALGGSIVLIYTAPAVITYGTLAITAEVEMLSLYGSGAWKAALATPFGQMALKSTIDATAQGLFNNGKVNPVAAIVGGAVPGNSWGAAVTSGIVSEATNIYMNYKADPKTFILEEAIIIGGVKSAIAAPGGMHMGNFVESAVGNSVAGDAGGAIFSNYLSSEIDNAK